MDLFIQQLLNGLATGSLYAMWAIGYGLVYQVLGLMHFAHGDTLLVGLFVTFALMTAGVPTLLAIALALMAVALLAMAIERTVYRPLVIRRDTVSAFVAALGAAYVLRNIVSRIWGSDTRVFPKIIGDNVLHIGGVYIHTTPLITLAIALAVVGLFSAFLVKSKYGQAIVALAQDRTTANLMGIPANRMIALIYALSGVLGLIGALLYMARSPDLRVTVGFFITLKAFVAAIIGGIGRIEGALLGGLLLGVLESLVSGYVSSLYSETIVFAILGLVLVFRPTGLIGRKELVKF